MIIRLFVVLLMCIGFTIMPNVSSAQSKEPAGISFDEIEKRFQLAEPYKHALRGDLEALKKDLEANPALLNARDKSNIRVAECAILGHQKEVVKFLIEEKKFDLKSTGDQGMTLLHVSAMTNAVEIAKYLIKRGIEIDAIDEGGQTSIHMASGFGNYEYIEILKDSKANLSIIDKGGFTALGYAKFVSNAINSDDPDMKDRATKQVNNLKPVFHGKEFEQFNSDVQKTIKLLAK